MRHQRALLRRFVVQLTPAEREAAMEALASRLAGPIEGNGGLKRTSYEGAEMALSDARLQNV